MSLLSLPFLLKNIFFMLFMTLKHSLHSSQIDLTCRLICQSFNCWLIDWLIDCRWTPWSWSLACAWQPSRRRSLTRIWTATGSFTSRPTKRPTVRRRSNSGVLLLLLSLLLLLLLSLLLLLLLLLFCCCCHCFCKQDREKEREWFQRWWLCRQRWSW